MTALERIKEYFKENEEVFTDCIEELDRYNGYLGDDRYYEMYMLDELYYDTPASEILTRAFFGYDEDYKITDQHGEEHRTEFNPNKEYFRYNGYGNLVSSDWKDYSDHLDDYCIESMAENRMWIDSIDDDEELSKLFDAMGEEAEEAEEA